MRTVSSTEASKAREVEQERLEAGLDSELRFLVVRHGSSDVIECGASWLDVGGGVVDGHGPRERSPVVQG